MRVFARIRSQTPAPDGAKLTKRWIIPPGVGSLISMPRPRVAVLFGVCLSLVGCQNNTVQLEDAGELDTGDASGSSSSPGTGDDDGSPTTTGAVPLPPGTTSPTTATTATSDSGWNPVLDDGWWLLALDTGSPGLPYQFVVSTTQTSPGVWDMTLQSLALDVGSTTSPRFPVGEVRFYPGVEFGEGTALQFYTGELTIPGEANPIDGTAVTLDAFLDGSGVDGDPFCGPVVGSVIAPIQADLTGSTFATTQIPDPETLPLEFPSACP
jgi:hypothetical protein